MKIVIVLCALLVGAHLSVALPQLYYTGGTYFRSPAHSSVSAEAVTVALASLLSVAPPLSVSPQVAGEVRCIRNVPGLAEQLVPITLIDLQVEQLLQADLFNRPDAVLCIAVAGSHAGQSKC